MRRADGGRGQEDWAATAWEEHANYHREMETDGEADGWIGERVRQGELLFTDSTFGCGLAEEQAAQRRGRTGGRTPRAPRCGARHAAVSGETRGDAEVAGTGGETAGGQGMKERSAVNSPGP